MCRRWKIKFGMSMEFYINSSMFSPHRIFILIYTSLIESHINYCLLLWGTNYDKIFKLQKQAIRTISLNHFKARTSPLFKSMNLLDIRDTYQLQLLKLYYKVKNSLVPSYFTNFTIYNRNNVHTSRYLLRNKRVNVAIPPKEYLKRNVQYQLLELMSRFDEELLQRAETFNMKSFILKIKTHFINQYEINCIQENLLCLCTGININLIHFFCLSACVSVYVCLLVCFVLF